MDNPEKIAS